MWLLCFLVFAATMPVSIILPMLPYIGQTYGASPFEVSFLFALMPSLTIVVAPLWGRLSDRIGRRPVFLISLVGLTLAFLQFAAAHSMTGVLLARGIQGLTGGTSGTAFAMVADTTAPRERARKLGLITGSMAFGFIVGPIIGGLLMSGSAETFSQAPPAYFGAALSLVATALAFFYLPETKGKHRAAAFRNETANAAPPAPLPQTSRATIVVFLAQFLIAGWASALVQFALVYWLRETHSFPPTAVSFALAWFGASYFFASAGVVGWTTRLWGDERAFLGAVLCDFCGIALFLISQGNVWLGLMAIAVFCVGNGVWSTILTSLLSRTVAPEQMGVMLGLGNGATMIGRVAGPLAAGALLAASPVAPFALCLGLSSIVVAATLWLKHSVGKTQATAPGAGE